MKLTERRIKALGPGRYSDSDCPTLTLLVQPTGRGRSWVQRLVVGGRRVDRGLGSWPLVTLQEARLIALENRRKARAGRNPFAERQAAATPTLRETAERTLEANRRRWSASTVRTWLAPMANHVFKRLGGFPVDAITRQDVIRILLPIWTEKPSESKKVLQRLRTVFEWALAHNHVSENVCANGGIKAALPPQGRTRTHHAAVDYREVPATLKTIAESRAAASARACAVFIVLTASRSNEARGARWSEIDTTRRRWTIPAERMKSREEHVVPLSDAALNILAERRGSHDVYVFASERTGRPLSHEGLKRTVVGVSGTIHGFRSSFRDWASEETGFAHAVVETSLAHAVGNEVERAYRRGKLLDKRRRLMAQWADYATAHEDFQMDTEADV